MVSSFELRDLAVHELSSVCFVRDYVELHFDGPILRCLADPVIDVSGTRFEHPRPGSRDALCQLIGDSVRSAIDEADRLVLEFTHKGKLIIPKVSEVAGPEVAHLVPSIDGHLDVAAMLIWENMGAGTADPGH